MKRNRLSKLLKLTNHMDQETPGKRFEETVGLMRPEQVTTWPKLLAAG
jgi:hypothetical protein